MSAILRCKAQWKHEQRAFSRMGLFSMLTKTRIWAPCPAAVLRTYKSYTRSVSLILTSFWLLTVNHVVSSISAWNQLGGVEPRDLCWYHVCRLTMSISSLTGSSNYVLCYFLLPSDAQWDTLPMHLTDFPYSTRCGEKNLHWTKSFWKHPSFSSTKTLRLCAAIWVLALGSGNRCILWKNAGCQDTHSSNRWKESVGKGKGRIRRLLRFSTFWHSRMFLAKYAGGATCLLCLAPSHCTQRFGRWASQLEHDREAIFLADLCSHVLCMSVTSGLLLVDRNYT